MPSLLGRLVGLSFRAELLMMNLIGLINSTLDWSSLKWTNQLDRIWNLSLTQQSFVFDTIDEHWIKTILSWIVVTRIIVAHVYTFTYITNIYPILTWNHPNLLLPWMLLSFFKNVLIEVIVIAIALLLWHEERFPIFLLLEFIFVKLVSLVLAVYNWYSNSCLYSQLKRLEKLRALQKRLRESSFTSEDSSIDKMNASFLSTRQRTRSLTTLLSAGSQETNDSRDSISRIFEDSHLTAVEKSMKILGITEEDVEKARARRLENETFQKVYLNIVEERAEKIEEIVSKEIAFGKGTTINHEEPEKESTDFLEEEVEDHSTKEEDEKQVEDLIAEKVVAKIETSKTKDPPAVDQKGARCSAKKRAGYEFDESKRRKQMKICLPYERKILRPCFPLVQKRERKFCPAIKSKVRNLKVLKEEEEEEKEEAGTSKSSTKKNQKHDENDEHFSSAVAERSKENTFRSCECTSMENSPKEEREETLANNSSVSAKNEKDVFRMENRPCDFNLKTEFPLPENVDEQLLKVVSKTEKDDQHAEPTEGDCLIMEFLNLPKGSKGETLDTMKLGDSWKTENGLHRDEDESMKSLVISTKRKTISESAANTAANVVSYILDIENDDSKENLPEYSFGDTAIPKLLKNSIKIFDGCYEKGFVENSELRCLLRQMEKKNWNVFSGQISTAEGIVLESDQIYFYDKQRGSPTDLPNSGADKTQDESQKAGRSTPRRTQLVSQGTQVEAKVLDPPNAKSPSRLTSRNAFTQTDRPTVPTKSEQKSPNGKSKTKFFYAKHKTQKAKTANQSPSNSSVLKEKENEKSSKTHSKESGKTLTEKQNCQVTNHSKEVTHPQKKPRNPCACKSSNTENQNPSRTSAKSQIDRKTGKSVLENFATFSVAQTARVSGFEKSVPGKPPVYPKRSKNRMSESMSRNEDPEKIQKTIEVEVKKSVEKKSTYETKIGKLRKDPRDLEEEREARQMRTLRAYNELTLQEDKKELEAKKKSSVFSKTKPLYFRGSSTRKKKVSESRKESDVSREIEISYDDYLDKENLLDRISSGRGREILRKRSKESAASELLSKKHSTSEMSENHSISQSDKSKENSGSAFSLNESSEIFRNNKSKENEDASLSSEKDEVPNSLLIKEEISQSNRLKELDGPKASSEKSFNKNQEMLQNQKLLDSGAARLPFEKYPTTKLRTEKVAAVLLEHFDRLHGGQAKEEFKRSEESDPQKQHLKYGKSQLEMENTQMGRELERVVAKEDVREISLDFCPVLQNYEEASDDPNDIIECFVRHDPNAVSDGTEILEDNGNAFSVITRRVLKPQAERNLREISEDVDDSENLIFRRIKMVEELEVEENSAGNVEEIKDYGDVARKIIQAIEMLKSEPDGHVSKNVGILEGSEKTENIIPREPDDFHSAKNVEDYANTFPENVSLNSVENAKHDLRENRRASFLTTSFLENQGSTSARSFSAINIDEYLQLLEDREKNSNQSEMETDFGHECTREINDEVKVDPVIKIDPIFNDETATETETNSKHETTQKTMTQNTSDLESPETSTESTLNSTGTIQLTDESNNDEQNDSDSVKIIENSDEHQNYSVAIIEKTDDQQHDSAAAIIENTGEQKNDSTAIIGNTDDQVNGEATRTDSLIGQTTAVTNLPLNLREITRNIECTFRPRGVVLTNKNLRGVHMETNTSQESQQRDIVDDNTSSMLHGAFSHKPEIILRAFHRSPSPTNDSNSELQDTGAALREVLQESFLESASEGFVCRSENEGEIFQNEFPGIYEASEGREESQGFLTTVEGSPESSQLGSCDLCIITISQEEPMNSDPSANEAEGNSQLDLEEANLLSNFAEILGDFRFRGLDLRRISSIEPEVLRELANIEEFSDTKTACLQLGEKAQEESSDKGNDKQLDVNCEKLSKYLEEDICNLKYPSNVDKSDVTATVLTSLTDNPGPSSKPAIDFPQPFDKSFNEKSELIESNKKANFKENVTDTSEESSLLNKAAEKLNRSDITNDDTDTRKKNHPHLWMQDIIIETIGNNVEKEDTVDFGEKDALKEDTEDAGEKDLAKEDSEDSGENCGGKQFCCVGQKMRGPKLRKSPFAATFEYKLEQHQPKRGRGLSSGYLMDFNSDGTLKVSTPKISENSSLASNYKSSTPKSEIFENPLSASEVFPISDADFRIESLEPIETCWSSNSKDDLHEEFPKSAKTLQQNSEDESEDISPSVNEEEIMADVLNVEDERFGDVETKDFSEKTEEEDGESVEVENQRVSLRIVLTFWLIVFLFYIRHFYEMLRAISKSTKSTITSRLFDVHTVSTSTSRLLDRGVLEDHRYNKTANSIEAEFLKSTEQTNKNSISNQEAEEDSERQFIDDIAPNDLTCEDFDMFNEIEVTENCGQISGSLNETVSRNVEISAISTSEDPEDVSCSGTSGHSATELQEKEIHFENSQNKSLLNNTITVVIDENIISQTEGVIETIEIPSTSKSEDCKRLSDNEKLHRSSTELREKEIYVEMLEPLDFHNESLQKNNEEVSDGSHESMKSNREEPPKITEDQTMETSDQHDFLKKVTKNSSAIKDEEFERTDEGSNLETRTESKKSENDLKNTENEDQGTESETVDESPSKHSAFQNNDSFYSSFENSGRSENAISLDGRSTMEEFLEDSSSNSSVNTPEEEYESCS